ncbi:MAG TPA: polyprenyl diphosphate synthase [Patescibacteria group bacterium]|nr:polyprenyl diphosphate synthase [Patescibacteria group bacterium]
MSDIPQHIGIIMDGNRRWAKAHGLSAIEGHRAGYKALKALLPAVKQAGIPYFTVYAFSSENWSRAKDEVKGLMQLLKWVFTNELKSLIKEGIKIRIIGSLENIPDDIVKILRKAEKATAQNEAGTLGICFNYGGQHEIVDATKKIIADKLEPAKLTIEKFAKYLYEPDIPPIDLIIRTSGEQRLSNFMLWRAAYSELVFVHKHWPDFNETDLDNAIKEYSERQRRYGT